MSLARCGAATDSEGDRASLQQSGRERGEQRRRTRRKQQGRRGWRRTLSRMRREWRRGLLKRQQDISSETRWRSKEQS